MKHRTSRQVEKGDRFLQAGQLKEARNAYRRALRARPSDVDALARLAALESDLGAPAEAVPLLQRLAKLRPDDIEARLRLAAAMEDCGDLEAAEEVLAAVTETAPGCMEAHNNLGNVLQAQRRFPDAFAAYRRALDLDGGMAEIWVNAGNALDEQDGHADSIPYYERAIELDADSAPTRYYLARAHLAMGAPDRAMAEVEHCLALDPADQRGIALKGVLHAELGQEEESRRIFDYDRLIREIRPEAPEGFADPSAFRAAVVQHIRDQAELDYDPAGASTKGGWHSGDLMQDSAEIMTALKLMLRTVFEAYLSDMEPDPDHPFLRQSYTNVRVVAQAQLLDSQGYLLSHIHPAGWVSGAYYLGLPDMVSEGDGNAGWIEFGRPTEEIKATVELERRCYQPEEGKAVLFPSYFFHGTRPFESETPRISLGMDLVPKR